MTNPTPELSFKVKFEQSVADTHQALQKVNSSQSEGPILQNALLTDATVGSMDLQVSTKSTMQTLSSGGIMKKTGISTEKVTATSNKRKLTFKVDEKDEIVEEIYTYPFPSDVDDNDVWWMDDELDQLLTEAMLLADHYTRKRKDWQNRIKKIMKLVSASSNTKRKEGEEAEKVKGSDLDFVCDSEARGLELYIHPIFQKNREKAIKGVVKVQAEYNASEKAKGKVNQELRLKVLRAQSLKLTQLARCMARTIADGDRRACVKCQEEEQEVAQEEEQVVAQVAATAIKAPIPAEIQVQIPAQQKLGELAISSEDILVKSDSSSSDSAKATRRPPSKSVMRALSPHRSQLRSCGV